MAPPRPRHWADDALPTVTTVLSVIVGVSLFFLAVRSYTRLELRWDAWQYHVAYAARAGHLNLPFHMDEQLAARFDGYPPLAHFLEGVLWRITGSVNATGTINIIGLGAFLFVCHRLLRAPVYIVGLIALTTPLVIIHAATNYIDLFSNAFLATALVVLIHVYLFRRQEEPVLLVVGLGAAVVASWSKLPLVPLAAAVFVLYLFVYRMWEEPLQTRNLRWFGALGAVAAFPFVRNLVVHGNPLWPSRVPFFRGDAVPQGGRVLLKHAIQKPPPLAHASQPEVFFRSLFEIGHPWHYADRPRWTLDQGGGQLAYRSGGFWFVGVVVFLAVMIALLWFYAGRRGRVVIAATVVTLVAVAFLPQSHVLRYYLFIPLVWAGVIGMLFPRLRRFDPVLALGLCVVMLAMFWSMFRANQSYFRVEHVDYVDAASYWGSTHVWPYLKPGVVYCDVRDQGRPPRSLTLTGPTMHEFTIYVRPTVAACPPGSVPIVGDVVHYGRSG
jgi:hypothetical protein